VLLLRLKLEALPIDSTIDLRVTSCSTIWKCNSSILLARIGVLK
jgi:hypothetical protein